MKASIVSAFVLLALAACEEMEPEDAAEEPQRELSADSANEAVTPIFHAAIGAPIDAGTGARWIENHRRVAGSEVVSYTIRVATLRRILGLPGRVGISLQHARFVMKMRAQGHKLDEIAELIKTRWPDAHSEE